MPAVMRTLAQFDRRKLEGFISVAIGLLDLIDDDSDFEGQCNEDEISRCTDLGLAVRAEGPSCPIADPGGCEHDGREPDHDDEQETWASWMDHPAELHVGHRPGHTEPKKN